MGRVKPVTKEQASPELQTIYQNIENKLGKIPNIFLNLGNSVNTLQAFLALSTAAEKTSLNPKLREQIALMISQANDCNYCLAAHTTISKAVGLDEQSIIEARRGESQDAKTQAILKFVKAVVNKKGHVSNQEVEQLKAAGINDKELTEIFLNIMVTTFTNYFNHITDPAIDFPIAPELALKQ